MVLTTELTKFTTASPAIASYDYTEIEDGLGYSYYYPFTTEDAQYLMTGNSALYSHNSYTSVRSTTGTLIDQTFQMAFNSNKELNGIIYYNVPLTIDVAGSSISRTMTVEVKIYHYDGTTQTQLGSTKEVIYTANGTGSSLDTIACFAIDADYQHFRVGEYIQLNLKITYACSNNSTWGVGHDPANRDFGTYGARQTLQLPFKLNI